MIPFFSIPVALAFPTLEGWLALRILEGNAPVLCRLERLCAGFILGCTLSAFVIFWAVLAGVPLTVWGFLSVHGAVVGGLYGLNSVLGVGALAARGALCVKYLAQTFLSPLPPRGAPSGERPYLRPAGKTQAPEHSKYQVVKRSEERKHQYTSILMCLWESAFGTRHSPRWLRPVLFWMIIWTAIKIAAGGYDLLISPPYFDDTYANWNMRAKAFYLSEDLLLGLPKDDEFYFGGRVPGYPMTVYLTKVWLAQVTGEWSEPAVNSVHFLWFLAFLGCFFTALRRSAGVAWSIAGTYILVSLPIFLVHGSNAYADILMSAHVFLALYFFYQFIVSESNLWLQERSRVWRRHEPERGCATGSWCRLFGFATAMMVFVKNEAFLIFLPPILFLFVWAWWRQRGRATGDWRRATGLRLPPACRQGRDRQDYGRQAGASLREIVTWFSMVLAVAFPWWLFKMVNGLTFGNAQDVKGMLASLSPNAAVLPAIESGLLYTGSYLILFPVALLLIALAWRRWVRSPLGPLILFAATVFVGEAGIYVFAQPLATEAIRHTGFGRGMVHLLPLLVFVCIVLLRELFEPPSHHSLPP